jgi:hypothetical protein
MLIFNSYVSHYQRVNLPFWGTHHDFSETPPASGSADNGVPWICMASWFIFKWGYPKWMVYFMENPNIKRMITGGVSPDFRTQNLM